MIYAPGLSTGCAAQALPALATALDSGDLATAREYRGLLIRSLRQATSDARKGAESRS